MALITTVGGNDSDSYVTVQEADAYLGTMYGDVPASWDNLDEVPKENRLKIAALIMNSYGWRGVQASRDQRLAFPRWWRTDVEHDLQMDYEDTFVNFSDITENVPVVPTEVKYAQIEVAYQAVSHIMQLDPLAFPEKEIKMFELGGSLGIEFFGNASDEGSMSKARLTSMDIVYAYLGKWLSKVKGAVI